MRRTKSGIMGTRTRFLWGLVTISALAAFVALPAGSALAKRIAMVGSVGVMIAGAYWFFERVF